MAQFSWLKSNTIFIGYSPTRGPTGGEPNLGPINLYHYGLQIACFLNASLLLYNLFAPYFKRNTKHIPWWCTELYQYSWKLEKLAGNCVTTHCPSGVAFSHNLSIFHLLYFLNANLSLPSVLKVVNIAKFTCFCLRFRLLHRFQLIVDVVVTYIQRLINTIPICTNHFNH